MAGLDYELESVIVDLSATPLEELAALDDAVIAAISRCGGDMSTRLWNLDKATAPNE